MQSRAADYLRRQAGKTHSKVLALIATKVEADPFTKVKKMIKDLIVRLMEDPRAATSQTFRFHGVRMTGVQLLPNSGPLLFCSRPVRPFRARRAQNEKDRTRSWKGWVSLLLRMTGVLQQRSDELKFELQFCS